MDIDLKKYLKLIKQHTVLLIIITLIFLTSIGMLIITKNEVKILNEDNETFYSYRGKSTVQEILSDNNIVLKENDVVEPDLLTILEDGDTITIKEAYPVEITVDNKVYSLNTTNREVQDIIEEAGIDLERLDIVEPGLQAILDKNKIDPITVVRVTEDYEEMNKSLAYKTTSQNNKQLDKGVVKTVQKGQNGEVQIEEKVVYHDGVEFSREVVKEEVVKEPINEVKEIGTNTLIATSRGSKTFTRAITVTATGYCSCSQCVGSHNGSITASGKPTTAYRTVAASSSLPFGTDLYIPYFKGASNGGMFVVEDRGGSIGGNRIDIYFNTHEEAVRFGRRTFKVYVLQ